MSVLSIMFIVLGCTWSRSIAIYLSDAGLGLTIYPTILAISPLIPGLGGFCQGAKNLLVKAQEILHFVQVDGRSARFTRYKFS